MSDHPIEKLIRDFQDSITRGTYDGIYALDETGLERVMECQADACVRAYVDLYQIPADLDLDAFLEKMKMGGSSKIEIRRDGEVWRQTYRRGDPVSPFEKIGVSDQRLKLLVTPSA